MVSLNESFLKGFTKNNKYFVDLMEDWWLDEEKNSSKGKVQFPPMSLKYHT
jgi:hypothetical protein